MTLRVLVWGLVVSACGAGPAGRVEVSVQSAEPVSGGAVALGVAPTPSEALRVPCPGQSTEQVWVKVGAHLAASGALIDLELTPLQESWVSAVRWLVQAPATSHHLSADLATHLTANDERRVSFLQCVPLDAALSDALDAAPLELDVQLESTQRWADDAVSWYETTAPPRVSLARCPGSTRGCVVVTP